MTAESVTIEEDILECIIKNKKLISDDVLIQIIFWKNDKKVISKKSIMKITLIKLFIEH